VLMGMLAMAVEGILLLIIGVIGLGISLIWLVRLWRSRSQPELPWPHSTGEAPPQMPMWRIVDSPPYNQDDAHGR
jgi:hypothetical protein